MSVTVSMPQLGETVTEGTILRWAKQVGDTVTEDEILLEISTDKVDTEVPSPAAGTVLEILVPEGETVEVGTPLVVIGAAADVPAAEPEPAAEAPAAEPEPAAEPVAEPEIFAPVPESAPAPEPPLAPEPVAPPETTPEPAAAPAPAAAAPVVTGDLGPLSPVVRKLAGEHGVDLTQVAGTGRDGRITRKDVEAFIQSGAAAAAVPVVEVAAEIVPAEPEPVAVEPEPVAVEPEPVAVEPEPVAVEPEPVAVEPEPVAVEPEPVAVEPEPVAVEPEPVAVEPEPVFAEPEPVAVEPEPVFAEPEPVAVEPEPVPAAASLRPEPSRAPEPAAQEPEPVEQTAPSGVILRPGDRVSELDRMRLRIADNMLHTKRSTAHVWTAVEVDFEAVEQVRRRHKDAFKAREGFSLTYMPFISRATIDALAAFPVVNSSFHLEEQRRVDYAGVHLGVAVDLDQGGLVVMTIPNADGLRMRGIARKIREVADTARSGKLMPDDVVGSTFTITNPGPFGSFMSAPIINLPNVAILSTDTVAKRPVVVTDSYGNDAIGIRHIGYLGLTWDHRAFDGSTAVLFLRRIKEAIETWDWEHEIG
jgi:2-oxoglutarate dehydrogenase E2 component (dihydrolipoamide succinyltransferase)